MKQNGLLKNKKAHSMFSSEPFSFKQLKELY